MDEHNDYMEDMRIDETALDYEWLEQPTLMFKYAKLTADAKLTLDKVKDKLDFVRAELDGRIRANPKEFGMEKITESAIMNTIISQEEYIQMQKDLLKAKYNFDITRGAADAISARKDALENMVKLFGMQYFAGPNVPHNVFEIRKKKNEQTASNKVASKLKNKEKE